MFLSGYIVTMPFSAINGGMPGAWWVLTKILLCGGNREADVVKYRCCNHASPHGMAWDFV